MRIGILGAGGMAGALGAQWVRAGHELMVAGRDPDRTRATAERIEAEVSARALAEAGVRVGSFCEAAGFGDVVLLAVPHEGVPDVLGAVRGALRGWALVDCVNAVLPGFRLAGGGAFAERVAALVPGTPVVKAFNLCHVDVWRLTPPAFDGRALVVPVCGDDPAALETVRGLVRDIGCTPADGGGLDRAGLLEATAAFAIGLWTNGVEAQAMLPPLAYSPPAT